MESMKRAREILYSVLEYALAAMFIRGGIRILFFDVEPVALPGILAYLVGEAAIFVYGAMFLLTGLLLIFAKLAKKKTLHKTILMVMYLTCIYVFALSVAINGIVIGQLLTVVIGVVAAALWIRWKFKTEYISPTEFDKTLEELRDDLPPSHNKE
jgi:hypothetical protein